MARDVAPHSVGHQHLHPLAAAGPPHAQAHSVQEHIRPLVFQGCLVEPPHQPVNTLGLDSLATVELRNALEGGLGVVLPVTRFLQGATIAQLASDVLAQLSGSSGPSPPRPPPVPCTSCTASPTTR